MKRPSPKHGVQRGYDFNARGAARGRVAVVAALGAEALFLTQPALSRSLRALEDEMGQPLFDRVGRRSELTPFGREVLERGRQVVFEVDELASTPLSDEGARILVEHYGPDAHPTRASRCAAKRSRGWSTWCGIAMPCC
jgi:hypothetical protein